MSNKILFGFHAVTVRLKTTPKSVVEIHVDTSRRDQRMRQFIERATAAGSKLIDSDDAKLQKMCGTHRHQGLVARVEPVALSRSLDDTLDELDAVEGNPLLLVLDGITDPHIPGCLPAGGRWGRRACRDRAQGPRRRRQRDGVSKVASGAAETVPYFMVTNLARTLNELKDRRHPLSSAHRTRPRSRCTTST